MLEHLRPLLTIIRACQTGFEIPVRCWHLPGWPHQLNWCTAESICDDLARCVQGHPAFQTDASLEQQLATFLLAEKLPPYVEFTQAAQKQIFGSGIKHQVRAGTLLHRLG